MTSCAPEPKNGDTTKDSDASSSNTPPVDLNTDDLSSDDILLISDTTAPVITIDTQIADADGYTDTVTPSFDVTSDEDGTLTVGGSCAITGTGQYQWQVYKQPSRSMHSRMAQPTPIVLSQ